MKHLIAAAVLVLGTTAVFGQKNAIEKYYQNYRSNDTFSNVQITGKMFELTTHIEADTPEEQELLDALSKIEGCAFTGTDSLPNGAAEYKLALQKPGSEFEELMNVQDKEMEATFFIQESNGIVSELLVVFGGNDGFGVGTIWGEIDLKTVSKIMQKVDMGGMDMFDEKAVEYKGSVNYYPNPVKAGQNGTLQIPENMKGIQMKVYDLKGKEVINRQINDLQTQVPLSNLAPGTYVLNLYKGNTRFYIEQIVVVR